MEKITEEDMEEDVEKVEEDTDEEVVEEAAAHMKMELTSHISPVILKIQSGTHSQTKQGKVSLRTQYTHISWRTKRGAPPAPSVPKRITRIG